MVKILEAAVDTSRRLETLREVHMALKVSREKCWHWLMQFLNGKEPNISVSLSQAVLISLQKKKDLMN